MGTTESNDELDRRDMARLCEGHDAALNDLMERHAPRLFHYLIRQTRDEAEAQDMAQESFARVFEHRARFNPRHRFSTWLYTIATNQVRDRARRHGRHPQVSLEAENRQTGGRLDATLTSDDPHPAERMAGGERVAAVRDAVGRLPEDLRTALILFEFEERSQAEIAAIQNCSPKAVEMRLYRARQQLKAELEGWL